MFDPVIFREYDIRGVYNKQFDDDFAYNLGKAFCSYVYKKTGKKISFMSHQNPQGLFENNFELEISYGMYHNM